MSSYNLKELARMKGTNIKRLAEQCGVPPSTLYAIASGGTNIGNVGIDLFLKISEALDMSAEELYRGEVARGENGSQKSSNDLDGMVDEGMRELMDIYRDLSDQGREQVLVFARGCKATYPADR